MRALIDITVFLVGIALVGGIALPKIYNLVKKESLTKVQKGLPPLTPYTQQLTGMKLDLKNGYKVIESKEEEVQSKKQSLEINQRGGLNP